MRNSHQAADNYGGTNNNGNLVSVTEYNSPSRISMPSTSASPPVTTSFTYDGVNRFSSVTDSSYARTFCYDAFGNGWVTAFSGTPGVPGNAPQQIGAACSGAGPYTAGTNKLASETFDNNGNESTFRGNTVNYDAENRVASVMSGSTTLVSYKYDGDGRRVQKTTPSGTTTYVYDNSGALMAEYIGTALSKEYVRFHSSFIGSNVDLVAIENAPGSGTPCTTCFVIPDYLGNVRMMADNTGRAISRHDYLPFGEEASADPKRPAAAGFGSADGATQRFTGKERDAESGLDYFGARYYGSALGRLTSPDPSGLFYADPTNPQSLNLYSYVRNNPLANIDPTGLSCVDTSNGPADDGDGKGCAPAGVSPSTQEQRDKGQDIQNPQNVTVHGGTNAAGLETQDAVSAFIRGGSKVTITYLPNDPFTLNFQRSLGMLAILAKVKQNCSASSGNGGVGTGEAAANSAIDSLTGNSSVAEDQLGAFTYSYSQNGGVLNVTVSNPITLNSLAYHALASNQEDAHGNLASGSVALGGDTMAGSGIDRLGRVTGSVPFGRIDQLLQIQAANPCH